MKYNLVSIAHEVKFIWLEYSAHITSNNYKQCPLSEYAMDFFDEYSKKNPNFWLI